MIATTQVPVNPTPPSAGHVILYVETILIASASVIVMGSGLLIKFLIGRSLTDFEGRVAKIEKSIDDQNRFNFQILTELKESKEILSTQFVHREDWIRSAAAMDAKLDAVHRRLDRLIEMQMNKRTEDE